MIGTNNIGRNRPEDMAEGFTKIIELIKQNINSNCQIYVIGIPPQFSQNPDRDVIQLASEYNHKIEEICIINNLLYINLSENFFTNGILDTKYFIDIVHLSDEGYNILYGAIQNIILQ